MKRPIGQLVLYGFTTYAAIFMLWSFFAAYNLSAGLAPRVTSWVATAMVVALASRLMSVSSFKQAATYGLSWAGMHIVFDAIYVVPTVGFIAFGTYFVWVNYAIALATPFLVLLWEKIRPATEAVHPRVSTDTLSG